MKRFTPEIKDLEKVYLSAPFSDHHLLWKARYLVPAPAGDNSETLPQISIYRLDFELPAASDIAFHLTGLERYDFFLDGERIAWGPERGDRMHLSYESFRGRLAAGRHRFSARVWSAWTRSPNNQMKHENCFLLEAEGKWLEKLSTGFAPWKCCRVKGFSFPEKPFFPWSVLDECRIDLAEYGEEFDIGNAGKFTRAALLEDLLPVAGSHAGQFSDLFPLFPAQLPAMYRKKVSGLKAVLADNGRTKQFHRSGDIAELRKAANEMLAGKGKIKFSSGEKRRIIIDLGNYYCAFPRLTAEGAGEVKVIWTEAFYLPGTQAKGDRGDFEGKELSHVHYDIFVAGGKKRSASTLWYRAGKYVVLEIKAGEGGLTLHDFTLEETHYPLKISGRTEFSDPFFSRIEPVLIRASEMCMHEVYFDCPFYEQMMYVGDTRLQSLNTYVLSGDARLPHRALRLFDWSRTYYGMSASCYPTDTYRQTILSFSLIYVGMLRDAMYWSNADKLVRELRRGMHTILDYFDTFRREDGLIVSPPGWNFTDWCTAAGCGAEAEKVPYVSGTDVGWVCGVAPGGETGNVSSLLNLFYLYALSCASEIEQHCGEKACVELYAGRARKTAAAVNAVFFDPAKNAYADDDGHIFYSEHAQILALLSGIVPEKHRGGVEKFLFDSPDEVKAKCTIYFSHYYFECCRLTGRVDKFFEKQRLLWGDLNALNFSTTPEMNEPSRSDCHAWGAHPLYHWRTMLLGVNPAAPGMKTVEFSPRLGELESASGSIPAPGGMIEVEWHQKKGKLSGRISLPEGISGIFVHPDGKREKFTGVFEVR